jgi:hypothetical protein
MLDGMVGQCHAHLYADVDVLGLLGHDRQHACGEDVASADVVGDSVRLQRYVPVGLPGQPVTPQLVDGGAGRARDLQALRR